VSEALVHDDPCATMENTSESETSDSVMVVNLDDMSLSALTSLYNRFAAKPLAKFKNTSEGRRRLADLLPSVGKHLSDACYEVPMTNMQSTPVKADVVRGRVANPDFVPGDINGDHILVVKDRRESRPGTNAARDKEIFAEGHGKPIKESAYKLKTKWGGVRFWLKRGVIEIVSPAEFKRMHQTN
jgi:hypothetical protein